MKHAKHNETNTITLGQTWKNDLKHEMGEEILKFLLYSRRTTFDVKCETVTSNMQQPT